MALLGVRLRDDLSPRRKTAGRTFAITMRSGWLARAAFVFSSQLSVKTLFERSCLVFLAGVGPPFPPVSWNHRPKTTQIFELKGLICKIFRNKDLAPQRALKMGLGQL